MKELAFFFGDKRIFDNFGGRDFIKLCVSVFWFVGVGIILVGWLFVDIGTKSSI